MTVGFTFTGCHIWDGWLYVENSTGFSWVGGVLAGEATFLAGNGTNSGAHAIHSTMFRTGSYNSGVITNTGTILDLKNNFYMDGADSTALNN